MHRFTLPFACLLLLASLPSRGANPLMPQYSEQDDKILSSAPYLSGHPDLRWRNEGLDLLQQREFGAAIEHFLRAARHADKASQALIAQMHWKGEGVPLDRALGYVWMDLAAERLYPGYVELRERYGKQMDAAERERALEIGEAVFAEYGDNVAKPRMEGVLRRHRSRGGSLGADDYQGSPPGIGMSGGTPGTPLRGFHDARFWKPDAYWTWQDETYESLGAPKSRVRKLKPLSERKRDAGGRASQ